MKFLLVVLLLLSTGTACQPLAEEAEYSDVVTPTNPAKVDPQVRDLVHRLTEGSPADKAKAAEKAGRLGPKASSAAEALCHQAAEALSIGDPARRTAALSSPLDALEKIDPQLFPHVRAVVIAPDHWSRGAALQELDKLGHDGRAALPVVTWYLEQDTCVAECLHTMASIAPENLDVFDVLVNHLIYKAPMKELKYTEPAVIAAAAAALGEMAAAEPAQRSQIVTALRKALNGAGRLEAVRSMAKCGPAAGRAEAEIKALRYDSNPEVQQAVDATLAAIRGYLQAAAKMEALREPPEPKRLAQLAADANDPYAQQLANERLRKIHPQLERLSVVLFQPRPPHQNYSNSQTSAGLAELTPIGKDAGPWAAALVDRYATKGPMSTSYSGDGWEMHRAAYATLARIAPDAPEVHRSLLAVCQMHIDRRREPLEIDEIKSLPHYWTGGELVAIAAADPQVERGLCGAATALTAAARIHYSDYNADTAELLNTVLGNLAELAKKRPDARKNIATALVEVMRHRASAGHTTNVNPDALEAALLVCDAEAYAALQAEGLGGSESFSGWEERAVEILRKTRPEGDPSDGDMQFAVGEQVWLENGGWMLNATIVEVLGGRYCVRTLGSTNGSWVTPDALREPALPVPKDGYQVGDEVEVLVKGQWLPAKVGGDQYGVHWVSLEESDKTAQPAADEIRPRTTTRGAPARFVESDDRTPSYSHSTSRQRQK